MKFRYQPIDSHIHMYTDEDLYAIEKIAKYGDYKKYTVLSSSFVPPAIAGNLTVAWAKQRHPKTVYGYASLHSDLSKAPDAADLRKQAEIYIKAGFDGIKMIDGKPTIRKNRVPLDDSSYDLLFDYLEETEFPLLYHINDPIEFWDKGKIPQWALEAGYLYDDSYPTQVQIMEETIGILKKHPNLHMTIAHLFFLSNMDRLSLAEELLATYPNLLFDMTPGWEMFEGFGRNLEGWRNFIEKHANRIVFGTDIAGAGGEGILEPLQKCLETSEVIRKNGVNCYGVCLSDDALYKIYQETYEKLTQKGDPHTIDESILSEYKNTLVDYIKKFGLDEAQSRESIDKYWKLYQNEKHGNICEEN